MISIEIPDFSKLTLHHLVLDYNGTLAVDGKLLPGVSERLRRLANQLEIHVLTADTFGSVAINLRDVPCTIHILPKEEQDQGKLQYVENLGAAETVSIGNGRNDSLMLKKCSLGLAVIQDEGAAISAIFAADIVLPDIMTALDLLVAPLRLIATLRS